MFDISKLKSGILEQLDIDETLEFTSDMLKTTEIKRLENVKATGTISRIEDSTYHLTLTITGNMVLSCARSLEEVDHNLKIYIDKNIEEGTLEEEKQVIFQNGLDISSIVWENIVLEVPLRVVKEDANFLHSGDGWSLIDENDKTNNSPFSELQNMLDMEGKE